MTVFLTPWLVFTFLTIFVPPFLVSFFISFLCACAAAAATNDPQTFRRSLHFMPAASQSARVSGCAAATAPEPQTFAPSFQVMPAASQSARVSGCGVSSAANAYPPQAKPNVNARTSTGDLIAIPPSDDGILTIPHSNFTLQHSFCGPEQGRDATKYQVKDSKRGPPREQPWPVCQAVEGFARPCGPSFSALLL